MLYFVWVCFAGLFGFFAAPRDTVQIPTQAGHLFRFDRGHHSDLKPATYSDLIAAIRGSGYFH